MFLLAPDAAPDRCPDRETLAEFSCGRLAEPDLETVAQHLEGCAPCLDALSEIQSAAKDGFDARLRQMLESTSGLELSGGAVATPPGPGRLNPEANNRDARRRTGRGPLVGTTMGRYTLLDEIGQGGMGVVYRAELQVVKQVVALKTIPDLLDAGPDQLARFRTEGKVLARLDHPNVVRFHHFDDHDGRPYFTMELVQGGTLADKLRGGPLAPRAAAKMVQTLAGAVAYAHGQEVVHRDLKPANVLIGSDGDLKVADFGLAKVLDESGINVTETGAVMGTPSYMAPEQAAGRTREIGARTDVYALGAVLYESLTGAPPFLGDSKDKTLALVQEGNVVPPSRLRKEILPDLEAVCLKCLETLPGWRYASAQALADDLGRWLRGEATRARPLTRARRAARWARRNARRGLVAAVALVLALGGAIGGALYPRPPVGASSQEEGTDETRKEIEAEVARAAPGQAVTLIGETGKPRWFRWKAGQSSSGVSANPGGYFQVETKSIALLELLSDPQTDRYRVVARVKHTRDLGGAPSVGLYVGRCAYPGGGSDIHALTRISFDDVSAPPKVEVVRPDGTHRTLVPTKQVTMNPRLLSEPDAPPALDVKALGPPGPELEDRTCGDWHDLAVTVGPDQLVAEWDGRKFLLSVRDWERNLAVALDSLQRSERHRNNPFVLDLRPSFVPRGGLGLYVVRASASFNQVTVAVGDGKW